jgi:hypothetical protein
MPAAANIVINDGQGTPVAHTFAPAKTVADFALLEDRAGGIYVGFNKLTFSLVRPTGPAKAVSRNLKLSMKVETPKLESSTNSTYSGFTPAPTVSYRPVVEIMFTFPERCTLQDRKDLQAYAKNLLANTFSDSAVQSYELPY